MLEGSIDDADWFEIDRKQSTTDLNDKAKVQSYRVKSPGTHRFFRLTQTGPSHCGSDIMAFTSIELFGTLRNPEEVK